MNAKIRKTVGKIRKNPAVVKTVIITVTRKSIIDDTLLMIMIVNQVLNTARTERNTTGNTIDIAATTSLHQGITAAGTVLKNETIIGVRMSMDKTATGGLSIMLIIQVLYHLILCCRSNVTIGRGKSTTATIEAITTQATTSSMVAPADMTIIKKTRDSSLFLVVASNSGLLWPFEVTVVISLITTHSFQTHAR